MAARKPFAAIAAAAATSAISANDARAEARRQALLRAFHPHADDVTARAQRAYMKSTLPFFGLPKPLRTRLTKPVFQALPPIDHDDWLTTAQHLWRTTSHREQWYAALDWMALTAATSWPSLSTMEFFDEVIVSSSWWDIVDEVASQQVGALLVRFETPMRPLLLQYAHDDQLWRRRAAIICQLRRRHDLDLELLARCIRPSLGRKEFFLRKAIGWALRQASLHHADWVVTYVDEHHDELSPLSRREAIKHLVTSSTAKR